MVLRIKTHLGNVLSIISLQSLRALTTQSQESEIRLSLQKLQIIQSGVHSLEEMGGRKANQAQTGNT